MHRIIALISILFLGTVPQVDGYPNGYSLYPSTAVIVDMNYASDIVTVEDSNGFLWQYFGCEDYNTGDLVSLIMDSRGTPETVLDDTIVSVKYSGYYIND